MWALALLILLLGWWFGGWLSRRERLLGRLAPNVFIASLYGQILRALVLLGALLLALTLLDATALLGTLLGAAGIVGLAVGFAVRDTVENYVASVLLSIRNPLKRFAVEIPVSRSQPLAKLQALALNTLKQTDGVLDTPRPLALFEQDGPATLKLVAYGWVNQAQLSFAKVASEAVAGAASMWIVLAGVHRGAPFTVVLRMLLNVAVENIIGSIPVIGDLFDFVFRANLRNMDLIRQYEKDPSRTHKKPLKSDSHTCIVSPCAGARDLAGF